MKVWLKRMALLLALMVILLGVAESWLRTFRVPMLVTPSDYLQPQTAAMDWADVEDDIRLVALGDSIVHGLTLRAEQSWPGRLETLLQTRYPYSAWKVINSGICGETAVQGLARMGRDVVRFRPQVLFVAFGLNDCYLSYSETDGWRQAETFPKQTYGPLGEFRLYRALRRRLSAAEPPWSSASGQGERPRVNPDTFRAALQEILQRAKQAQVPYVFLLTMTPVDEEAYAYWPEDVQTLQMAYYERYNTIIREVAATQQVSVIESGDRFQDAQLRGLLEDDGIHLTAAGQEQLALTVFGALQREGIPLSLAQP